MTAELMAFANAAPQPRKVALDPFEVCVYETRTGVVRRWLPIADFPDWERGLNIAGSWEVQVPLDDRELSKEDLHRYSEPWYFSWAVVQGMKIWQAGPVVGERYQSGDATTSIYGTGIWGLLTDHRLLLNPTRATTRGAADVDADVCFGTGALSPIGSPIPPENQNLSLAGIAARLTEILLAEPGGDLPIDLADTTAPGDSERTYAGYELGFGGQRLAELTQVDEGPEQEFVPYFTDTSRSTVRHRHEVGQPRLGQLDATYGWDSGQALVATGYERDGSRQARRAWQRGTGMDRNTLIGFAEDLDGVTTGPNPNGPLLETLDTTHSQVELLATIDEYAAADIATDATARVVLSPTVRIAGDDGKGRATRSPALASVSPGDVGVFAVRDDIRMPDGDYVARVLRMRSARSASTATLDVDVLAIREAL